VGRLLQRGGKATDHPRLERYFEIERINSELAQLETEIATIEWRLTAGQEIRAIADSALAVARRDRIEGDRFLLTRDVIATSDGQVLVDGRGEELEVSDALEERDLEFFRTQRRRLQDWTEEQESQPQQAPSTKHSKHRREEIER
jgi:hypothetical protein